MAVVKLVQLKVDSDGHRTIYGRIFLTGKSMGKPNSPGWIDSLSDQKDLEFWGVQLEASDVLVPISVTDITDELMECENWRDSDKFLSSRKFPKVLPYRILQNMWDGSTFPLQISDSLTISLTVSQQADKNPKNTISFQDMLMNLVSEYQNEFGYDDFPSNTIAN